MNAPDLIVTWRPRRNSLAERVLAWLPECPQRAATAIDIAMQFGVSKPENVHGQLAGAVAAGAIERLKETVPHLYRLPAAEGGDVVGAVLPQAAATEPIPHLYRLPAAEGGDVVGAVLPQAAATEPIPWIRCADGLPPAGRKVLAYARNRKLERVTQAMHFPASEDNPAMWREITFAELDGVTHWAPMPAGPR